MSEALALLLMKKLATLVLLGLLMLKLQRILDRRH